ncbi:MAG: DUF1349 domain-containing protein, partial [ANME-2 cluster archaeon]|nr:DUF1349 domain-containing protein [ANME-2 cluster archaeon]
MFIGFSAVVSASDVTNWLHISSISEPVPPIITMQPVNHTCFIGETATFSVMATGAAPLYYQWQKNGVDIDGANSPSYTTPPMSIESNGSTYRVVVTNDIGTITSDQAELIVDPTFPVITVWYGNSQKFGQKGNPQKWVNILGNTYDPSGIASLNYSLNNGIVQTLSIGPDGKRLQSNGDFNIEIDYTELNCGNNLLIINAANNAGNVKTEIAIVNYSCNNIWPRTYSINWNSVTTIQDHVQVVDGLWTKEPNSIRPSIIGYDRLVAMGDITWDDYEVTVPITINEPLNSSSPWGPNVGISMRWQGHYDVDGKQPRNEWWPLGALGVYIWVPQLNDYRLRIIGNNMQLIANDESAKELRVGVPYMFKMRAQTINANTIYSLKVWEEDTPEPLDWTIRGIGVTGELKHGSVLLASHYVNASFGNVTIIPGPFNDPFQISNIESIADASSVTIRWGTNELATSEVAYGSSTDYEYGSIVDSTRVTSHNITLTDLTPGTNYHYQITSIDEGGHRTNTSDLTFTTLQDPSNIISDDFSASTLNTTLWTEFNPKNDAIFEMVGTGTSDALLSITVPAGVSHNIWEGGNFAPRIMQGADNTDFKVEIKFESPMISQFQSQGVIVQQDDSNYLRFDIFTNETNIRVFAASFTDGTFNKERDVIISPATPSYLRVKRQGDRWTLSYSLDGTNWIAVPNFDHALTVTSVGPFVMNHGNPESSSPAFTGFIDYFFNSASPIVPEDPGLPTINDNTTTGTHVLIEEATEEVPPNKNSGSSGVSGSSGSSGSSGGGGGGYSGEDFYNIILSETDRKSVYKNSEVSFGFELDGNMV